MARSKNRRKSAKQSNRKPILSLKAYILKVVRKLPLHECLIYDNWKESGKTQILVSRKKPNGNIIVGFYLVDLLCLGLKDSFYREMEQEEYENIKNHINESMTIEEGISLISADATLVFNIIYGAIEYAEDLGFSPGKDFAITEYILNDVQQIPFIDVEFGRDGMPFYSSGPDDNVQRVLKTLNKSVGEGNYHFLTHLHEFDEFLDEENIFMPVISQSARAEEKLDSLSNEDLFPFFIQLITADYIHDLTYGAIEELSNMLDEEDKEIVLHSMIEFFKDPPEGEEAITGKDAETMFEVLINQTFNQVSYYGHLDFLFEEDYQPLPDENMLKNIENLSMEEIDKMFIEATSRVDVKSINIPAKRS